MLVSKSLGLVVPMVAFATAYAADALACGGCFHPPSMSTQVQGHAMVLSISQQQTTLWDQIRYSGDPTEFAWVLPVKGMADLELSSDALFENLGQDTAVTIEAPNLNCPPPPNCFNGGSVGSASSAGVGGGSGGGVGVVSDKQVGPFEVVQLKASDPGSLENWLSGHGYVIPPEVQPIVDAYVNEGFDFLAMKLVPGMGIDKMQPVRITIPGANPTLPLRMVAAGSGVTTSITLWVMAEGRYEPTNFNTFEIKQSDIVWDWDTMASNYALVEKDGFDKSKGFAWAVEAAEPMATYQLSEQLIDLAMYDPLNSGYADDMGNNATQNAQADLDALFAGIPMNGLWVTRLHGELSRPALATDLKVGASPTQTPIPRDIVAQNSIGTPPQCPSYPPCDDTTVGTTGSGFTSGAGGGGGNGSTSFTSSCAVGSNGGGQMLGGLAVLAALALVRRRRMVK